MKLITIGSSSNATIRLNSSFVSSLHAEILLLDNGDIILTDRGSRNGTFVQNQKVEPNKDILIRRGDSIRFADVYLDWNNIPQIPPIDLKKIKGVYGVGSNSRNKYHLTGNTVSRFHATITETKKGKWFIKDHSTNGTTVNGKKITPETDFQIKHNDVIVCGGVPFKNPVPRDKKSVFMKMSAAAAAVIILALCIKFIISNISGGGNGLFAKAPQIEDMCTASVMVHGEYHYEVTLVDDPFIGLLPGWPTKYIFGQDGNAVPALNNIETVSSYINWGYNGTAFFISEDGKLATNRHVASPWTNIEDESQREVRDAIRQEMMKFRNDALSIDKLSSYEDVMGLIDTDLGVIIFSYLTSLSESDFNVALKEFDSFIRRFKNSDIKITGVHDYIGVALSGRKYNSFAEFDRCTVLKVSDNPETDIAVMQLNTAVTPPNVKYIYDINRCMMDPKKLKPQKEEYLSIGYPAGAALGLDKFHELQPTIHDVRISKMPSEYGFQMQGEAIGGNSGSPVCTKKGQLIGVVWGKSTLLATGSYGVHAKYLKELYDKTY